MTIQVWFSRLRAAAHEWDDASEQLTGARTSLSEAPLSLLGSRVEPHAQAFVDAWTVELRRLAAAAEHHGEALRDSATLFARADQVSVAESQALLPWAERDAVPGNPHNPVGPGGGR